MSSRRASPLQATTVRTTPARIAEFDLVGDYEAFAVGPHHEVFIDDRYDMYPASVVADSGALQDGRAPALDVVKRWNIDVVLWHKGQGPLDVLRLTGGWRSVYSDAKYEVLVRDPSVPPTAS